MLTGKERIARILQHRPVDRVGLFEVFWRETAAKWSAEGSLADSAAQLRRRFGLKHVAYTLRRGESASVNRLAGLLSSAEGSWASREYEMHLVDRIGGGDAFTAGLIHGLTSGWEPSAIVEFAAAASCLKHSIPGDFNLVSLDEVQQLVQTGDSGRVRR
jgi:2-dehydro-3-deoxygluconokinase